MYPQKCKLKHLKKKYQEKWENAYLTVKNTRIHADVEYFLLTQLLE